MSATATTPSTAGPAPWRLEFLTHLSKMDSPEFVLSTLAPAPSGSPTPYLPRARTCIYRGMWAELPVNSHNTAEQNERVYESDMPTITTDVRMAKVPELFASGAGHGSAEQAQGSGGGGPVECVFWIKEVMTQWRIRGLGYVVGPDIEGPDSGSSGVRTVKSVLGERMRVVKEEGKEGWSWKTEMNAHFENLSPGMRGSFKNPEPGTSVYTSVEHGKLRLGQKVTGGLEDDVARENFRIVVIRPDEVEQVDLTDPDKARRWKYTFIAKGRGKTEDTEAAKSVDEWVTEELWP